MYVFVGGCRSVAYVCVCAWVFERGWVHLCMVRQASMGGVHVEVSIAIVSHPVTLVSLLLLLLLLLFCSSSMQHCRPILENWTNSVRLTSLRTR